MSRHEPVLRVRQAGVLLHPTSLPGPGAHGTLGADARRFVDLIAGCGFSVWQTLPLTPPDPYGSPYQSSSAHAGHVGLIDFDDLAGSGWLKPDELAAGDTQPRVAQARAAFDARATTAQRESYVRFLTERGVSWLDDYALYQVLREALGVAWNRWPEPLRRREPGALREAARAHAERIEDVRFAQYLVHVQWQALREYAAARGITMFGDIPIFVAQDSADVWAYPQYFQLDAQGDPRVVAGVPPDYFSETGQRWGNPLYDWDALRADDYRWWLMRVQNQLEWFSLLRIDHFRGLEAYWEIPADSETAQQGRWVPAPGDELLAAIERAFGSLPLVAEDLGIITPEVTALRDRYGLPGMSVAHFAFDGSADNPHLPHRQRENAVMYSGTHDNDTTLGWFDSLPAEAQMQVLAYLDARAEDMPWALLRSVADSAAKLAIFPLQDLLGLGAGHRMNTPGVTEGNWCWRFDWSQVPTDLTARTQALLARTARLPGHR